MTSIEDEKKHEYIPLLHKEKEMDSLKYADDDDESTDGNIEENKEENEPSTSHKSTDGNIEEHKEENEPSTSHKETERKDNKPPDDSVKRTDENSEENEHKTEHSTPHKESDMAYPNEGETSLLLQKTETEEPTKNEQTIQFDDKVTTMPSRKSESEPYRVARSRSLEMPGVIEERKKTVERLQNELKEMYASAIELFVETYEVERSKPDDRLISRGYVCCPEIDAARKGTKSHNVDQDDQARIKNWETKETIKEDELFIKVYTTSDAVVKTFRKDELIIDKDELKGMCKRFDLKVRELLRSNSVDVTHQDELDNTLIHYAVLGNSLDLLSKPSKLHGTLNTKGNFGLTPLHIAALLDYSDVARELMKMNADIELKDKYNKTPLLVAAEYGSSKVIEILLRENACINQTDNQRRSVLHLATKNNNTDVLELILKKSRELETEAGDQEWKPLLHMKTAEGKTALHQAVFYNRKEIVKILLQEDLHINGRKTCLNMQDAIGKTALHHAVEDGSKEMVEILVQEGADIDCKDNDERTPLSHAAEQGMVEITGMLLYNWADHSALDKQEKWETDRDIHLLIEEIRKRETDRHIHLFIDDVRKRKTRRDIDDLNNYEKMAPVHYAAVNGHSEVVKIILGAKCSQHDIRSGKGRNCLDIAIDENHVETVLEIIKSKQWYMLLSNKTETETGEPQSPMRKLIVHMPDIAREVFTKCTEIEGTAAEFKVMFDYDYLDDTVLLGIWSSSDSDQIQKIRRGIPYTEDADLIKKNHPLMHMVNYKRAELLEHPLVSALLKKKWISIGLVFYLLNVMLYLLYLAMLTGFALDIKAPYEFTDISTDANICSEEEEATQESISQFAAFAKYCVIVLAAIEIVIELLEMKLMYSSNVKSYWKEKENLLEWIACICSTLFVVNTSGCTDTGYRPQWQWTCGTTSVFLAWINLLLLIQKFDFIGIYVVMLYGISKVFMKFFLVFSLLIVAFAVTFHCLLQNQEPFSTFWISLVKTTEMMIGELDYSTIFLDGKVHYNATSHVFFYLFMLFMSIIVLNTMTGLAVDDIREFRSKAGFKKKKMQIEFALEMERLSSSTFFRKYFRKTQGEIFRVEVLQPNKQSWFQTKILESWNLTEKDIKEALTSGTDDFSKEITKLEREIRNMDSDLKNEVRTTSTNMQEKMKSLELRLVSQLNKEEGMIKAYMQNEMESMESRFMSHLNKEDVITKADMQNEMKSMESRLMSQLDKIEETIFGALQEKVKTSMDTK